MASQAYGRQHADVLASALGGDGCESAAQVSSEQGYSMHLLESAISSGRAYGVRTGATGRYGRDILALFAGAACLLNGSCGWWRAQSTKGSNE